MYSRSGKFTSSYYMAFNQPQSNHRQRDSFDGSEDDDEVLIEEGNKQNDINNEIKKIVQ